MCYIVCVVCVCVSVGICMNVCMQMALLEARDRCGCLSLISFHCEWFEAGPPMETESH